jgi:hypothetical protein
VCGGEALTAAAAVESPWARQFVLA